MDLIYAARYTEVCDYAWHDFANAREDLQEITLPEGIWHVDTAAIPNFFKAIQNMFNRKRQYVVVSPSCDYGVCLQRYNHPAKDLWKWTKMQVTEEFGYNELKMPARLVKERCNPTDAYSIKCWSWTAATFPEIPANVKHWFLANCEINHSRVTAIPFGIFGNKDKLDHPNKIDNYEFKYPRQNILYINFQFYTTDRYELYVHFSQNFPELVTLKRACPFDEFLDDLATHKYVLCPPGNGADCYRTLEAAYMGAVPILEARMGCVEPYVGCNYPMLVFPSLFQVDPRGLNQLWTDDIENRKRDLTKLLWPYWKNLIWESRP
jgi:hypothetical protein